MAEFGVSNALSRRKPGFNSPWDYQTNSKGSAENG
jgi:hypothetical protein